MSLQDILKRIDARVAQMHGAEAPSDRAISLGAGLGADTIRNWRRAVRNGNTKAGSNASSIRRIAAYLGVTEAWIMRGTDTPEASGKEDLHLSLEPLDEAGREELRNYFEFLLQRRAQKPPERPE